MAKLSLDHPTFMINDLIEMSNLLEFFKGTFKMNDLIEVVNLLNIFYRNTSETILWTSRIAGIQTEDE